MHLVQNNEQQLARRGADFTPRTGAIVDELLHGVVSENLATGDTPQRARQQGSQPHGAQQGGLALQVQPAHSLTFRLYCSIDVLNAILGTMCTLQKLWQSDPLGSADCHVRAFGVTCLADMLYTAILEQTATLLVHAAENRCALQRRLRLVVYGVKFYSSPFQTKCVGLYQTVLTQCKQLTCSMLP